MTDNTIVFKWDISKKKNNVDDQENISVEFISDYMKVLSMQNHGNPGIIFNGSLKTVRDKVYTFYIEYKSCRDDTNYLWGYNLTQKTELFQNYKFLNGKDNFVNHQSEYYSENGDDIRFGILYLNPNLGDIFYLKRFIVIESTKQINPSQPINSQNSIDKTVTQLNFKVNGKSESDITYNNYSKSLFRHLPPFKLTEIQQKGLISNFLIRNNDNTWVNKNLPLGYNFALMFLMNDMTFNQDKTITVGTATKRLPCIDLELMYGHSTSYDFLYRNYQFIINQKKNDIPRNIYGEPMIPDKRNDNNYILSQFHTLLMIFHNKLFAYYTKNNKSSYTPKEIFKLVKKEVKYYWQWIIVNDILPRIVDNDIIEEIFQRGTKIYKPNPVNETFMPYEYINAISKITNYIMPQKYNIAYDYSLTLSEIMKNTRGTLPEFVIDWNKYFQIDKQMPEPQYCKKIDYSQTFNIYDNAFYVNEIASDLVSSNIYNLPSGQDIADEIKFEKIPIALMNKYDHNSILKNFSLINKTPLLLYFLKEAEIYTDGQQLTGVGGRIFAETIIGMLFYDQSSYLNSNVKWVPSLQYDIKNNFTMSDLIKYIYI